MDTVDNKTVEEVKKDIEVKKENTEEVKTDTVDNNDFIPYNVVVNVYELNVREEASKQSKVLEIINIGTKVNIVNEKDGFGKIADKDGWVMLGFTQKV